MFAIIHSQMSGENLVDAFASAVATGGASNDGREGAVRGASEGCEAMARDEGMRRRARQISDGWIDGWIDGFARVGDEDDRGFDD